MAGPGGAEQGGAAVRRLLISLGLPTLGLAFGLSILTTYGPVVLLRVAHSPARVGALIGGEGAFALAIPLVAGALSDRMSPTPLGRRLPFIIAGLPLVVTGLLLLPWASSYLVAGIAVLLFFVGYYLYYPPYRAMYADVLPRRLYARAQASQAVLRGLGLGAALMTGGLFLGAWTPLPFVVAAGVMLATTFPLGRVARLQGTFTAGVVDAHPTSVRDLVFGNRAMMTFAAANSMWEFSFAGLRTFIVLYVVSGLDRSPSVASAVIAVVAAAYVAGAPVASRLVDRFGILPVMTWSAIVFGVGLCYGAIPTTLPPLLVVLPVVALAGAILLTLPPALAFTLAPHGSQGAAAGIIDVSRGVGVVLGPVAVGAAVSMMSSSLFSATRGYAAMWPVIGLSVLLSVPLLRRLEPALQSQGSEPTRSAEGLRAPV
ncbi:MAG: maltose/moltooligosaccharide transporter [Frankiaceae bacterium]|nr:maltose/moltooligosaccharide transporter [Frankiaceae bacterium]